MLIVIVYVQLFVGTKASTYVVFWLLGNECIQPCYVKIQANLQQNIYTEIEISAHYLIIPRIQSIGIEYIGTYLKVYTFILYCYL